MDIQWTDSDPVTGERRFVCAEKFARGWRFKVRFRRRTDWAQNTMPTRVMWETLLDAIERRYQRREGIDDADVAAVKKILEGWRDDPLAEGRVVPPN